MYPLNKLVVVDGLLFILYAIATVFVA